MLLMHTRTQQEHYIWIRSLFLHLFLNQFSVSMTSDESFLLFSGGLQHNCLNNILNTKNNNYGNELPIIRRSSYYDADMFSVLAEDNKHNLSVLSSNIQWIHSKFSELEGFVDELSTLNNFKFKIICLQESWLSENDDLSLIQLKGYDCIAQGKSCSNKGGLITYVDQHIKYEVLINVNTYENWEGQLIQVNGGGLTQTFTIGNIYRPTRSFNEYIMNLSMNSQWLFRPWKIIKNKILFLQEIIT